MSAKHLLIVHGMGQHEEGSLAESTTQAIEQAFQLYDSLRLKRVADLIDVRPVCYNDIFETYRRDVANRSGRLGEAFSNIEGSLPLTAAAAQEIVEIEGSVGGDSFFDTHWLDVLFYRFTLLSELARLRVAEAIGSSIAAVGAANVHVIGHSLGSAVLHDTLAKAYGPDQLTSKNGASLNLSTTKHRLGGVHMIANVSRALQTFVNVDSSIVRPGDRGCCSVFVEYRHKLDPFTKVKPFDPTDNSSWISHQAWRNGYQLVTPSSVTEANVHSLGHYLLNPLVHGPLFLLLFGHRPNKTERTAASDAYLAQTVEGKAKALEQAISSLQLDDRASIKSLLVAGKAFKDLVKSFGEDF